MDDCTLNPSKHKRIEEMIKLKGLDPNDFRMSKVEMPKVIGVHRSPYTVNDLFYGSTTFHFCFDMRKLPYFAHFSPADEIRHDSIKCDNWRGMIHAFDLWLGFLKREKDIPNPWEDIAQAKRLVEIAVSIDDEEPFKPDEKRKLLEGLDIIRKHILEHKECTEEQFQMVSQDLDKLESKLETISRRDWLHTAIGVLFTIGVTLHLSSDAFRELFRLANQYLGQAFNLIKLLP